MKLLWIIVLTAALYTTSAARPIVVVFPFDPVMDSTYNLWGDQVKVLDYQRALQSFLVSDLSQGVDIDVVKSDTKVTSVSAAITEAREGNFDFAVMGTFAELPAAIRVDAQLVDVALGEVPRGYQASATAGRWEDLSTVADDVARQLLSFAFASSTSRTESAAHLILEGERVALGYDPGTSPRVIIEVNSPAPKIALSDSSKLKRCSVRDRSLSEGANNASICYSGDVSGGEVRVTIDQRGYYGYTETLSLAPGKVYRLVVHLEKMAFQAGAGR